MATIRLTKEFTFEAAHFLEDYDGVCSQLHGHSYRLYVTVRGIPSDDELDPKNGMVIDFGYLKQLVNDAIISEFDHSLIMQRSERAMALEQLLSEEFSRIVVLPYRPTTENLLADFAERLLEVLPDDVEIFSLRLHETGASYAEWYASDNI
ncbi:MAG: 6-carboxytetrahydropterin synthase [Rikenellaceae bacterium]|nr:6-carboxytetrahydropterin synthase [Rikenellaceae bacterium]MBR2014187.1 6-carboxytetrahydropterin synthase [Alistipes sp.]